MTEGEIRCVWKKREKMRTEGEMRWGVEGRTMRVKWITTGWMMKEGDMRWRKEIKKRAVKEQGSDVTWSERVKWENNEGGRQQRVGMMSCGWMYLEGKLEGDSHWGHWVLLHPWGWQWLWCFATSLPLSLPRPPAIMFTYHQSSDSHSLPPSFLFLLHLSSIVQTPPFVLSEHSLLPPSA